MASCKTQQFGNSYCPVIQLTVTTSGGASTNNTCEASWRLDYVTYGYTWYTSATKPVTAVIDGQTVYSGSISINGKTSFNISSGTITINRGTGGASRSVSFSVTINYGSAAWNGTKGGTRSGSGTVSTPSILNTYTISYNANGGSGAPSAQTKTYGTNLTLSSTVPTKSGYKFRNWNTASDGSGTSYSPGSVYSTNAGATLYAQWDVLYTISYNANGGSGAPDVQSKVKGANISLSNTVPIKSGYTFKNWNTASGGGGTTYYPGDIYSADANVTLYAQWQQDLSMYTISYHANGGSGAPGSQSKIEGTNITLSSSIPVRSGYSFKNWNTASNGSGTSYAPGATYSTNASVTLYAQWEPLFEISYNANGGYCAPASQFYAVGSTVYITNKTPVRSGYTFLGWSTSSTATSATYSPGASTSIKGATSLYAVWKKNDPQNIYLLSTGKCYSAEFIEGDIVKLKDDGIYAYEFIEDDNYTFAMGPNFRSKEFIEGEIPS